MSDEKHEIDDGPEESIIIATAARKAPILDGLEKTIEIHKQQKKITTENTDKDEKK